MGDDDHTRTRITLDRRVMSEPRQEIRFDFNMAEPRLVFGDAIILELKFTNRFPQWFNDLVQRYELKHQSAAKYVDGVASRGEHYFAHAYA